MVTFLMIGLGAYHASTAAFGIAPLDWAAPEWTAKHFTVVVAGLLLGALAGLLAFARAMTIEVRDERLNHLLIVLWQFLSNGSLYWVCAIGIAMSMALGREGAKAAVLQFGAERATLHVVGTGSVLGLSMGVAYFLAPILRVPLLGFLSICITLCFTGAWWHFQVYGIAGRSWILPGLLVPILLLIFAPAMIFRDHQQRRLAIERSASMT